jgi:hypothetical protein
VVETDVETEVIVRWFETPTRYPAPALRMTTRTKTAARTSFFKEDQ